MSRLTSSSSSSGPAKLPYQKLAAMLSYCGLAAYQVITRFFPRLTHPAHDARHPWTVAGCWTLSIGCIIKYRRCKTRMNLRGNIRTRWLRNTEWNKRKVKHVVDNVVIYLFTKELRVFHLLHFLLKIHRSIMNGRNGFITVKCQRNMEQENCEMRGG